MKLNPEERKRYEKYLINLSSEKDVISNAREEGKEEGREDGIEIGKSEIIVKMLKDGLSVEIVAKYTGMDIAEIEKLRYNLILKLF